MAGWIRHATATCTFSTSSTSVSIVGGQTVSSLGLKEGYTVLGPGGYLYEITALQTTSFTIHKNAITGGSFAAEFLIASIDDVTRALQDKLTALLNKLESTITATKLQLGGNTTAAVLAMYGALVDLKANGAGGAGYKITKDASGNEAYVEFLTGSTPTLRIGNFGDGRSKIQTRSGASWTDALYVTTNAAYSHAIGAHHGFTPATRLEADDVTSYLQSSANGTSWNNILTADRATGQSHFAKVPTFASETTMTIWVSKDATQLAANPNDWPVTGAAGVSQAVRRAAMLSISTGSLVYVYMRNGDWNLGNTEIYLHTPPGARVILRAETLPTNWPGYTGWTGVEATDKATQSGHFFVKCTTTTNGIRSSNQGGGCRVEGILMINTDKDGIAFYASDGFTLILDRCGSFGFDYGILATRGGNVVSTLGVCILYPDVRGIQGEMSKIYLFGYTTYNVVVVGCGSYGVYAVYGSDIRIVGYSANKNVIAHCGSLGVNAAHGSRFIINQCVFDSNTSVPVQVNYQSFATLQDCEFRGNAHSFVLYAYDHSAMQIESPVYVSGGAQVRCSDFSYIRFHNHSGAFTFSPAIATLGNNNSYIRDT